MARNKMLVWETPNGNSLGSGLTNTFGWLSPEQQAQLAAQKQGGMTPEQFTKQTLPIWEGNGDNAPRGTGFSQMGSALNAFVKNMPQGGYRSAGGDPKESAAAAASALSPAGNLNWLRVKPQGGSLDQANANYKRLQEQLGSDQFSEAQKARMRQRIAYKGWGPQGRNVNPTQLGAAPAMPGLVAGGEGTPLNSNTKNRISTPPPWMKQAGMQALQGNGTGSQMQNPNVAARVGTPAPGLGGQAQGNDLLKMLLQYRVK